VNEYSLPTVAVAGGVPAIVICASADKHAIDISVAIVAALAILESNMN
jgi:hypothetical protein